MSTSLCQQTTKRVKGALITEEIWLAQRSAKLNSFLAGPGWNFFLNETLAYFSLWFLQVRTSCLTRSALLVKANACFGLGVSTYFQLLDSNLLRDQQNLRHLKFKTLLLIGTGWLGARFRWTWLKAKPVRQVFLPTRGFFETSENEDFKDSTKLSKRSFQDILIKKKAVRILREMFKS